MTKPKLSNTFKERTKAFEIKFGGSINALSIKLSDGELKNILDGFQQLDNLEEYMIIPDKQLKVDEDGNELYEFEYDNEWGTDLIACLIRTYTAEENENEYNEAFENDNWIKKYNKQLTPIDLQQTTKWSCKCKAAPNGLLRLQLSKDQYTELDDDQACLFIGILSKYWTKKNDDDTYSTVFEPTPGYFENNKLALVDFIA